MAKSEGKEKAEELPPLDADEEAALDRAWERIRQEEGFAEAVARDQAAALIEAIARLPAEQREAFLLQVEGDLSVEEIATITDSSFETAKSRLRYARTKLRELLKEHA